MEYRDPAIPLEHQPEVIPHDIKILKKNYQFQLPESKLHNDSLNTNTESHTVEAIITPSGREISEKEKSNVLFIPGMIAKEDMLSNTLLALSRKGHEVFAPIHSERKMINRKHESLALIERQKAYASLSILEQENIRNGVIVATSLGGVSGLYTAYLDSQRALEDKRIKKVVLVNPAGIVKRFFWGLIFSSGKDVSQEKSNFPEDSHAHKKMGDYEKTVGSKFIQHPLRTPQELMATAHTDTRYMLKKLIESGIEISIICSSDDSLFPPAKIRKRLEELGITNINIIETKGTHYNFLTHPDEVMRLVDQEISR